jgi:hypothetical protein
MMIDMLTTTMLGWMTITLAGLCAVMLLGIAVYYVLNWKMVNQVTMFRYRTMDLNDVRDEVERSGSVPQPDTKAPMNAGVSVCDYSTTTRVL